MQTEKKVIVLTAWQASVQKFYTIQHKRGHLANTCCKPLVQGVNESLLTCVFPTCLKQSLIRPLLKKPDLDQEILKNYRPIANIPFLAKIIEKVIALQAYSYLETNKLMPPLQSAYRKNHSTETALLRVLNDILTTLDHRQDVVLVMLDLSAAFDTLDHDILISRLR